MEIWAHISITDNVLSAGSGGATYALRRRNTPTGTPTNLQIKTAVHRGLTNAQTTSWVWHFVDTNPGTGLRYYSVEHTQGDTHTASDAYISIEQLKR